MLKRQQPDHDEPSDRMKQFALLFGLGAPLVVACIVAPAFGAAVTAAGTIVLVVHTVLSDRP